MPVNNFEVVKATVPITDVQDQATGKKVLSGIGLSDFISIGYKDLGGEEDMIVAMHGVFENDILTLDLKSEDIPDLLSRGAIIYFYDEDNIFGADDGACIFYLVGKGPNAGQWRIGTLEVAGSTSFTLDTNHDTGYLYFYFD